MPRDRIALMIALGLVLAAAAASAREVHKEFHQSFDSVEGAVLRVEHGDGDIVVMPWDRDQVDVKVVYHVEYKKIGTGGEPALAVDFSRDGDEIRVVGREKVMSGVNIFFITQKYRYEYTVRAPAGVRLKLFGDDGDVEVAGWRADVGCRLDDGDIVLQDIHAQRVAVAMEDGDLRATDLQGELEVVADDGEVMISGLETPGCRVECQDGRLSIREARGDFEITLDDADAELIRVAAPVLLLRGGDGEVRLDMLPVDEIDWDLAMVDGDLRLEVAPGLSARVDLATEDGDIELRGLPAAKGFERERDSARGVLGDGRGRIRIRTDCGDITMRESP